MKGDFSRGHRPDHKRGERYRRVLLQQGRLVLDSDVAAGADATDRTIRDLARDVAGPAGSPDGGYVVTSGPPVALFDSLDRVARGAGSASGFRFHRDYGVRLRDRHPSLCLDASHGAGSVVITGRRRTLQTELYNRQVLLKVKLPFGVPTSVLTVHFDGSAPITLSSLDSDTPFVTLVAQVPADQLHFDQVTLALASNQAWISLIEGYQQAGNEHRFWFTGGHYHADGLRVEQPADVKFPEGAFPWTGGGSRPAVPVPTSSSGAAVIAYLEAREQLVTAVDAPGLREAALGGPDTTVRTRAQGVVKLARVEGSVPAEDLDAAVAHAFRNVSVESGRLQVTSAAAATSPDPCALPPAAGYAGADHRLYRFEVHQGGSPGASGASIKWSKNNGSELAGVDAVVSPSRVRLTQDIGLRDGDLLEITSAYEELWDGDVARVVVTAGAETFHAPPRVAGLLFAVRTTAHPREFTLHDPVTMVGASLSGPTADGAARQARRWDGLLRTDPDTMGGPATTSFALGDGITVELSGSSFAPGAWWEYEARAGASGLGESWPSPREPHGPERIFAPLARFEYASDITPMILRRWYDDAIPALSALRADDVRYDNTNVLATPLTVQAALDELFLHRTGGCCEAELSPQLASDGSPIGDAAERIALALDEALDEGGVLCLRAGLYQLNSTVAISGAAGRVVEIRGCPGAVLLCPADLPAFTVAANTELVLRDLTIRRAGVAAPLIRLNMMGSSGDRPPTLRMRGVTLLHLGTATGDDVRAISCGDPGALEIDPPAPPDPTDGQVDFPDFSTSPAATLKAAVDIEDCTIVAPVGLLGHALTSLRLVRTRCFFRRLGFCARNIEQAEVTDSLFKAAYPESVRSAVQGLPLNRLPESVPPCFEGFIMWETTGTCLAARSLRKLVLRGSRLEASRGLWADSLESSSLSDNWYAGADCVRTRRAVDVTMDRERVNANRRGIYLGEWVDGAAVRSCTILGRTGILAGATPTLEALAGPAALVDLQVVGNTFRTPITLGSSLAASIQIGPTPASESMSAVLPTVGTVEPLDLRLKALSYTGTLPALQLGVVRRVSIHDNRFFAATGDSSPDVCVLCTVSDPANFVPEDGVSVGSVANNQIETGMVGALLRGPGWSVRGNKITLRGAVTPDGTTRFRMYAGVVLWDCARNVYLTGTSSTSIVDGNTIDVAFTGTPTLLNPVVAIAIRSSNDEVPSIATVRNNVIECVNALISRDLTELHVHGNNAGYGNVLIARSTTMTFRGNRISGLLNVAEFDHCISAVIADNDLPLLFATGIEVACQAQGNRVATNIVLLPSIISGTPVGSATNPYTVTFGGYTPTTESGSQETDVLLQINGNLCANLFVGNISPATTSSSTLVQMNGNLVGLGLAMRNYKRVVAVGNFATDAKLPATGGTVINASNLDLTP